MSDPYTNSRSIEFRLRQRRFHLVRRLIDQALENQGSCSVLDIGGTESYWRIAGDLIDRPGLAITLVNLVQSQTKHPAFQSLSGDATDLSDLPDNGFDVVHSNSVIEHVGDWTAMSKMAENVRRLAPAYFLQTPNYWFPIEPHFRVPGFQWMPKEVRAWLLTKRTLGFRGRQSSMASAREQVSSVQLLTAREMARLFPDAKIIHERFCCISKSLMALRQPAWSGVQEQRTDGRAIPRENVSAHLQEGSVG